MKKIFIFGHKNPDTDSVCGAISYSYLKNELGFNTEPRVLGDINNETKYALNYFNFSVPEYLEDVKVKIKDIMYHKDYFVKDNMSIYDTYNFMNSNNITGIPIVDNKKMFVGYVSLKEIAKTMITDDNNILNTTFDNITKTLKSLNYIKIDDEIYGKIVAATFDDNTFINNVVLDNGSIVIVGDRQAIIDYAIESKVKLIIVIGNKELNAEQLLLAKNNNINIIYTPYTSFETSKLLGLSNNISTIKRNENCICLNREDYMTDFIDISNKTKHTNYPIIGKSGNCYGMLRLIDINEYDKNKVILVDHNSVKQSVDGIDEAEILEVIDHHNISDINTKNPINFRNMAVGSVNTIIYYLYKENNIEIPNSIAGLMISGIISDTVLLNSPTTTYNDRLVIEELSNKIGLNYKDYGMKLLKSGMDLTGYSIEDIIYRDYKTFAIDDEKFSIGQVLTVDFSDFKDNLLLYVKALNEISNKNGFIVSALYITNVLTKKSMIIYNEGAKYIIKDAYNLNEVFEGIIVPGILSRKKQMVPNIMSVLEKR